MRNAKRLACLLITCILVTLAVLVFATGVKATAPAAAPDIRFVLQAQAGIAAYTTLTNPISLAQVRPLFTHVDLENATYLAGDYTLAGRTDSVKLAIGSAGWIIAYYPREYSTEYLYDCVGFSIAQPSQLINPLERTLNEITTAMEVTTPTTHYYDFRNPDADYITSHWLYIDGSGSSQSTITLPLASTYLERGFLFCTALSNSKFWLNNELVDQQGSISVVINRRGPLGANRLRAGQANTMKIEALTIFGKGFIGGVNTVYSGTAVITSTGGYQRNLELAYPEMLGPAVNVYRTYLPIVGK